MTLVHACALPTIEKISYSSTRSRSRLRIQSSLMSMWFLSFLKNVTPSFPVVAVVFFSRLLIYFVSPFVLSFPAHSSQGRIQDFFLGGGGLVSCSNSTPIDHIVFFGRIPVVLENRRSSRGGGGRRTPWTLPLDPPLVQVKEIYSNLNFVSL